MAKYKDYLLAIPLSIARVEAAIVVARYLREMRAARERVDSPGSLVISAVDDPIAVHENVRGLAQIFSNARLCVVPDGGHPLLGHAEE